jgi:hypothetical protein
MVPSPAHIPLALLVSCSLPQALLVFQVPLEVAISQEGHMLVLFIQDVMLLHVGLLWMRKSINLEMRIMTKVMKSTWLKMMRK